MKKLMSLSADKRVKGNLKKEIKGEILQSIRSQEEKKWNNVAATAVACSGTATFVDLSTIAPGSSSGQRNGDSIKANHLRFALSCIFADTTNIVRVTLFKWIVNSTSDAPSSGEIYQDPSSSARIVLSPFVVTKPSRFKILFDKIFNLDSVSHPQVIDVIEKSIKFPISYDQGTNTGRNHVYVAFSSDSSAIPHPAFTYESFLTFSDD